MEGKIYNQAGKAVGSVTLPESIFGLPWNSELVRQVALAEQANARTPVAHTKDRGDVRGGGKKPWRQKGTGRARHGSRRSPIWRGGGITFGPRNEKNYAQKVNRKMRAKALYTALSQKMRDGEVLFVDAFSFNEPKSKEAKATLDALAQVPGFETLATKRQNAAFIAFASRNEVAEKSFRNFGNVVLDEVRNLSPLDVLSAKFVIIAGPEEAVAFLAGKQKGRKETEESAPVTA